MTLEARGVHQSWGRRAALDGVSVAAARGRITVLLGPNGAGKTTLLRCLVGAAKPTAGSVLLDGAPLGALSAAQRAARVAYVAQRPSVAAAYTVREVIELGRHALAPSPARIAAALVAMDLESIAQEPFPTLSAGQQQRCAFARALAQTEPRGFLVLDEPFAAMDFRHEAGAAAELRRLANDGQGIIVALHDLALACELADDLWLLDQGRLHAAGPAESCLRADALGALFGVHFTERTDAAGRRIVERAPSASLESRVSSLET